MYKETINSIYNNEKVAFGFKTDQHDCTSSIFRDLHFKIIVKGDLRIFKNNKLRKILTKGPNYGKPQSLNFSKAF